MKQRYTVVMIVMLGLGLCSCSPQAADEKSEVQAIEAQLGRYFASWSARDMKGYASCFDPAATIHFIDGNGVSHLLHLPEFIRSQEYAHSVTPGGMTEHATSWQIHRAGRMAQVSARWDLQKSAGHETGTDYYTFLKRNDQWKIVSLVFENDN